MSVDRNKLVARRFVDEVWNRKDLSNLAELVTEDYTLHLGGGTFSGRDGMKMVAAQWFEPYPDLHAELVMQVGEGDLVADHLVFTGHHSGVPAHPGVFRALGLPPIPASGRPFEFTQTHITRFEDGLMAETWEDFDRVRFWLQLGVELAVPNLG